MSLGKLLSMSRSFVAGKNDQGRYRVVEQGMLPRFGPSTDEPATALPKMKVPMAKSDSVPPATAIPERVSIDSPIPIHDVVSEIPAEPAICPPPEVKQGFSKSVERPGLRETAAAKGKDLPTRSSRRSPIRLLRVVQRWFQTSSNPFQKRFDGTSSGSLPRQTELRLDSVKVVRNDLGDADFEVVPARTVPTNRVPGAAGAVLSASNPEKIEGRRPSNRLFSAVPPSP